MVMFKCDNLNAIFCEYKIKFALNLYIRLHAGKLKYDFSAHYYYICINWYSKYSEYRGNFQITSI